MFCFFSVSVLKNERMINGFLFPYVVTGGGAFSERHGYPGYTLGVTCMQTRGEPETVVLDLQEP